MVVEKKSSSNKQSVSITFREPRQLKPHILCATHFLLSNSGGFIWRCGLLFVWVCVRVLLVLFLVRVPKMRHARFLKD